MRNKLLAVFSFLFSPLLLLSQNFNDPSTEYGLGELQDMEFAHLSAIEPLGLTHSKKSSYSLQNPATYASLNYTTFNIGLDGKVYRLSGGNTSLQDNRIGFGFLTLGFPIMKDKNWGASFGLVPVSQVGYRYSQSPSQPSEYTISSNGRGGLSKFYLGTGLEIASGLKIGVDAAYLFGSRDRFTTYEFPFDVNSLSSRKIVKENTGGFIFDGGFQYTQSLSEDIDLVVGGNARIPRSLNFEKEGETFVYPRSSENSLGQLLEQGIADTVEVSNTEGNMSLPGNYRATVEVRNDENWRLGLGAEFGEWSELAILDQNQGLSDAYEFDLAGQITPDNDGASYWGRMDYRLGIKYANSYLNPAGNPMKRYELNVGMGFPLFKQDATSGRQQESSIDFSVSLGSLRAPDREIWEENYIKFRLGFNLTENWFIERKIK